MAKFNPKTSGADVKKHAAPLISGVGKIITKGKNIQSHATVSAGKVAIPVPPWSSKK